LLVLAIAALTFLLPLLAFSADPTIPGALLWLMLGIVALGAARPAAAAAVCVILLPLSGALTSAMPAVPTRSEFVDAVLVSLAAGLVLYRIRFGERRPSVLAAPAAVLAAALVTSAIMELHALQVIAPRRPLLSELWTHVTTAYWSDPRAFPVLHDAWRWLAWLVIAVNVEAVAAAGRRVLWPAWLAAGAVGAFLTVVRFVDIVVRHPGTPMQVAGDILRDLRVTVLQPDLNAAGSYFLLFLVPAVVVAIRRRADRMALTALPLTAFAFAMARSRAAIGAALIVGVAAFIASGLSAASFGRTMRRAALAVGVAVVGLAAVLAATANTNAAPERALGIRAELAQVALTAAGRYPVFGVGLSDFIRSTRRFITDDQPLLQQFAPLGENAHNNFLQIAVELGIPAGLVFLWLVVPTAVAGFTRRGAEAEAWALGLALGIAAFLISALFGHPLLIGQVGATFFVGLGMAAGALAERDTDGTASRARIALGSPGDISVRTKVAAAGVAFYVVSLVWRL
jgi:hypothetical protein